MLIIILLVVLLLLMTIAPILMSTIYAKLRKAPVLHIDPYSTRDPRYFGKSFAGIVKKGLATAQDGRIKLSREEAYLDAAGAEAAGPIVTQLVLAEGSLYQPSSKITEFEKEIYCEGDIRLVTKGMTLRAAYSGRKMVLGNEILGIRWIDAEDSLAIYDNCELGVSASAGKKMVIGHGCRFQRLYAQEIRIGQRPNSTLSIFDSRDPAVFQMPVRQEKKHYRKHVTEDDADENRIVNHTVIALNDITVLDGLIIQGDVRGYRNVRLCPGAVVCGNVFAEGEVLLEENALVLGNILTQASVRFEEGSCAGQPGRIISVIARDHIRFAQNTFVYGYVSCEQRGAVEDSYEEYTGSFDFIETADNRKELTFSGVEEYESVQNFRKEPELELAVIPEGARSLHLSMFFFCTALKTVRLPRSLQRVENFAFADCFALEKVEGLFDTRLEELGISAFENCRSLPGLDLPATVTRIGPSAFSGCEGLRYVYLPPDSRLETLEDHCFRGCSQLEEIWLPDTVTRIGISVFRDCDALLRISLPDTCREQPGIVSLANSAVVLDFRHVEGVDVE